ncbi:MAG: hypothetical protein V1667_01430 [bacterium]
MKKLFGKIKFNGKYISLGLFALAAVIFVFIKNANAAAESSVGSTIANTIEFAAASPIILSLGAIAALVTVIFGALNTIVIGALVNIVKYNNFINEPSIRDTWIVARDLCNMFFILILLVVAFATILRIESYQWKKILPKLLIMAVLINFSRTICGLIIDASQIIMLTFVNAWANAGDFVSMLSMAKFFTGVTFKNITTEEWSVLNVVAGMLIGIMFLIICGVVLVVTLAVFLMRVIMLWIYIVLSPFAFLAAAFPAGQKYASQWWSEFVKYIINGPVLAFFIWMALVASKQINDSKVFFNDPSNANQCFGLAEGMCMNNFLPFIISIGMLLGGLMITQQIGGIGASIAGKGMNWIKSAASMSGKAGLKVGKEAGSWGLDWASKKTGGAIDFNLGRTWGRVKDQFAKNKTTRADDITAQVAGKAQEGGRLAMLTHGGLALKNLTSWKKIKWAVGGKQPDIEFNEQASKLEAEKEKIMTQKKYNEKRTEKQGINMKYESDIIKKEEQIAGEDNPLKRMELVEEKEKLKKEQEEFKKNDLDPFLTKKGLTVGSDQSVKEMDEDIKYNRDQYEKYKFQGDDVVESTKADVVSAQEKKIAQTDNADKLGNILKGALKEGNQGLMTAVARKMTKLGEYNDLCRIMKVGTGTKGMQALAKKFQNSGMSEQSSRGLIAEMGGICKNLGQFGGFYAMKMDKGGNWQKTEEDEAQAAQLAVMKKMQPQAFARTVGRLGLGYYDDPSGEGKQDKSTYRLSKAATAHLASSQKNLGEEYDKTGMAEALEYLNANVEQLAKNSISDSSKLMEAIKRYKGDKDMEARIRSVKT